MDQFFLTTHVRLSSLWWKVVTKMERSVVALLEGEGGCRRVYWLSPLAFMAPVGGQLGNPCLQSEGLKGHHFHVSIVI